MKEVQDVPVFFRGKEPCSYKTGYTQQVASHGHTRQDKDQFYESRIPAA
jgi:hypothetical protein